MVIPTTGRVIPKARQVIQIELIFWRIIFYELLPLLRLPQVRYQERSLLRLSHAPIDKLPTTVGLSKIVA